MNSHAKQPTPPTSSRRILNSPATRWPGLAALAAVALAAIPWQAGGTILAYEGLSDGGTGDGRAPGATSYTTSPASTNGEDNDSLHTQSPSSTGFADGDAWVGNGGVVASSVYFQAQGGGLSYTNYAPNTSGQARFFRSAGSTSGSKFATRVATTTDVSDVQWVAMLFDFNSAPSTSTWYQDLVVTMQYGEPGDLDAPYDGAWTPATFGVRASDGKGFYSTAAGSSKIDAESASALGAGTHLFLMKFEDRPGTTGNDRYDDVTLWIDPALTADPGDLVGGLAAVSIMRSDLGGALHAFDELTISAAVQTGNEIAFDEFILTDDYQDIFSTATDTTPPTLDTTTSVSPADGATGVVISSNLVATFSEAIDLTGSGSITLRNQSGGADIPVTLPGGASISGAVLTITPDSALVGGKEYAVEISSDAIKDLAGTPNLYAGLLATDDPNWSFTADGTPPTKSSMGPMATDVSPFSDLTLSFDEDVLAVAGKNIELFLADGTPVETIAADDPAVIINGSEVTIDLSDLAEATAYYVNIDNGAFTDLSGNAYAGIDDDTTWAFTTGSIPTGSIFLETFSGSGDLDTTEPDVTTGGATWTAATWQKDGTIADEAAGTDSAWLPFVPLSGSVYTLTVTIDAVASGTLSSSWSAFGFGNGSDTSQFWQAPNDAAPWALYRATGTPDQIVSFSGVGVGGVNANHDPVAGPVTLSIVLDTTAAAWTAEWFEGTNSLRTHTYTTNPAISTVGFGRNADSDGPISSFSLTAAGGTGGPVITDIEVTSSGDVVLTTDVAASGVIAKKADSPEGPYSEVASTETGANERTIDSADVDLNADGREFYVVE